MFLQQTNLSFLLINNNLNVQIGNEFLNEIEKKEHKELVACGLKFIDYLLLSFEWFSL